MMERIHIYNRFIGVLVALFGAFACTAHAAAKVESPKTSVNKTGQQHSFEDLLIQGKYHFSDESVTTVEEDKVLDSLLGIRTDFKDRIEASAGWN